MDALALDPLPSPRTAALAVMPKGRLLSGSQEIFALSGLGRPSFPGRSLEGRAAAGRFVLARGRDVPLYVRSGAAELGIVGRDVLLEEGEGLRELADLGFGGCRLVLAAPAAWRLEAGGARVASRYPSLTARYLARRGLGARVVPLAGAVEGAVGAGLADAIVDVCETGATLRAHGLVVLDTVAVSSARLVAAAERPLTARAGEVAQRLREVAGRDA